jgi:hypothetical protein
MGCGCAIWQDLVMARQFRVCCGSNDVVDSMGVRQRVRRVTNFLLTKVLDMLDEFQ